MTPAELVTLMRDWGTLTSKAFHAKYPWFEGRASQLAKRHRSNTWDCAGHLFVDIARGME